MCHPPIAATSKFLKYLTLYVIDFSNQYNILPPDVTLRLRFATTAMHAYGHEWACQLVYNPRLADGLGLSDGEGTECLWSRLIKLIGIEQASSVSQI